MTLADHPTESRDVPLISARVDHFPHQSAPGAHESERVANTAAEQHGVADQPKRATVGVVPPAVVHGVSLTQRNRPRVAPTMSTLSPARRCCDRCDLPSFGSRRAWVDGVGEAEMVCTGRTCKLSP